MSLIDEAKQHIRKAIELESQSAWKRSSSKDSTILELIGALEKIVHHVETSWPAS